MASGSSGGLTRSGKRERGCNGNMPQRLFPNAKTSAAVPCITETPGSLARKLAEMEAPRIGHVCDFGHPEDRKKLCLRPRWRSEKASARRAAGSFLRRRG
jgi:hypothetical protein